MTESPQSHSSSLGARYLYHFKLWSCFLVLVQVPLDFLFRLDSFLLCMTAVEIAVNTAVLSLIMFVIAALIALATAPLSLLVSLLTNTFSGSKTDALHGSPPSWWIIERLLLFFSCCIFARLVKVLIVRFGYVITINHSSLYLGAILCSFILYRNKADFGQHATRLVDAAGRRLIPPVLFFSLLSTGIHFALRNHYQHQAESKPAESGTMAGSAQAKQKIIVITFDALAAEDMSLFGYRLKTTPNLDAFAEKCFTFDNAISAANWTRPSVASLLTGEYPSMHRVTNTALWHCPDQQQDSLPAFLKKAGFRTSALVVNWGYAHPYANGTASYFDDKPFVGLDLEAMPFPQRVIYYATKYSLPIQSRYDISAFFWLGEILNDLCCQLDPFLPLTRPVAPPQMTFELAEKKLAGDGNTPSFLWLHIVPPHAPYLSPPPFLGAFFPEPGFEDSWSQSKFCGPYGARDQGTVDRLRLRYDENVLYADHAFGDFTAFLERSGRLDDSIVIVSADHGEAFSHGFCGHGGYRLYQPVIHIPLLIHLPGQRAGNRLQEMVSQTDIAPTILDLLGYKVPSYMQGKSLKPLMKGTPAVAGPIFSMNLDGNRLKGKITRGSIAVIEGSYKYIRRLPEGAEELYDIKNDRQEKVNLARREPEVSRRMYRLVCNHLASGSNGH